MCNLQETRSFLAGEQRVSTQVTQSALTDAQVHLAHHVDARADTSHPADIALATWHRIDAVLSSVFGRHGMAALFRRSLYLARPHYPWLQEVNPGANTASDFDTLRAVLVQRAPSLALAAHGRLLKTFCDLLARLIGESLSHRLLQPVWLHPTIGTAAQDAPP